MATLAIKVFKLIVLHNKLMEEKDLDFFLKETPDPVQCLERLVASNMIPQPVATKLREVYEKKLLKEQGKAGHDASAAPSKPTAKPAPTKRPAPSDDDDDEEPIPLPDELGESQAGGMALNAVGDQADALNKPDELNWVEAVKEKDENWREAEHHVEQLELDDEEFEHHEIVKPSSEKLKAAPPTTPVAMGAPAAGTAPAPAPTPAAAHAPAAVTGGDGLAAVSDHERIPCNVPPQQYDPMAVKLLKKAVQLHASDVHLAAGSSPFFRLNGSLVFTDLPKLTPEVAERIVLGFMDDAQQQRWLHHHDLDFSLDDPELGRFRVNALLQFRGPSIIFRCIPRKIPTLADLGLPTSIGRFTEYHQGLVLLTGPAGCGKTTTAAALIDMVNESRHDHIITVEDPVEFLHTSKNCNVTQRQVPTSTLSFAAALKAALREDPDVIMIGEMRDLETVSLAIRAAETGHLVIGTLQTKSAARTIDRVIDVFPEDQQAQIRAMLSESLRGIVSQQLIPRKDGKGRVVAIEILNVISSVSNLIRDAKTFQLPSLMQTGRKQGQVMMDDSLDELLRQDLITKEEAAKVSENPKRFRTGAAAAG